MSAAVAISYTLMGGLYSVAYTDVIQLAFMFFGLWFCVPFILSSPFSANVTAATVTKLYQEPWLGKLKLEDAGRWIDELLLLATGGICYQAFHQRLLSTASDTHARITCYAGAVLCLILGIPSLIVGAVATSTDWNQTVFGLSSPYEQGQAGMILPIALQYLCPSFVSLVGIGALAAAVMSSADSALLSAASQLGRNIYKNIIYKRASEKSIVIMVKVSVLICGLMGAGLAMLSSSIHVFWILSADVLYSMMAAQVICVLFLPQRVNHYGACTGFVVGLLLRGLVGEHLSGLPTLLPLPWDRIQEDGHRFRLFPFRTAIMLISTGTILLTSYLAVYLSEKRQLKRMRDAETDLTKAHYLKPIRKDVEENDELTKEHSPVL
ncbi:hypothetical protein LDENG_00058200 [Lucifuga dentata]|nr:hypothetical protein LDENG_00058200 [Lucifuga dentata]